MFVKVWIDKPLGALSYKLPTERLLPSSAALRGARVEVPVKNKTLMGIIQERCTDPGCPPEKIKELIALIDPIPLLPLELLSFMEKISLFYHYPLSQTLFNALPSLFKKNTPLPSLPPLTQTQDPLPPLPTLHPEQDAALSSFLKKGKGFNAFLLYGVTGSGKTVVYLHMVQHCLQNTKQILILVPEIALTPQTLHFFEHYFGEKVLAYHSKLTPKQRYLRFARVLQGESLIIIGTRSALLLPFSDLALCIVDEEHDSSYKQQSGLLYQARDMAIWRAKLLNIPIVLGSATPSLESFVRLKDPRWTKLSLEQRANQQALPPLFYIDRRGLPKNTAFLANAPALSPQSLAEIQKTLDEEDQVLIFINRRGFAPIWMCLSCSYQALCPGCQLRLCYHEQPSHLSCHHCSYKCPTPLACPHCQEKMSPIGMGTQRIEGDIATLWPQIPLFRLDSDTLSSHKMLEKTLKTLKKPGPAIVIGTQLLAKGHNLPHITLVLILDSDSALYSIDFRATERLAQVITQVRGRAGRFEKPGRVFLETSFPQHPLLKKLSDTPYADIVSFLLKDREKHQMPPYSALALFRVETKQKEAGFKALSSLQRFLSAMAKKDGSPILCLGPVMAPSPLRHYYHRAQLLIRAPNKSSRHYFLQAYRDTIQACLKNTRWSLDIEANDLS
jgi:primosomal protein N' (replication factor Y) (superfamily II helicase)